MGELNLTKKKTCLEGECKKGENFTKIGQKINSTQLFVVFQTLLLLRITCINILKTFFSCLDTAMDNKYNKCLHRSTQRAWFVTAEWGIKLPGGVDL